MVDAPQDLRHVLRMLMNLVLCLHRAVLLAVLTAAMVATGFAHRMPTPQDAALAFVLANGASAADICGDGPGDAHPGADCLACQITGAADLPPAALTLIDLDLAVHAAVIAPRENLGLSRVTDPAHRPQGPPVT
jgi:hypothetical protein